MESSFIHIQYTYIQSTNITLKSFGYNGVLYSIYTAVCISMNQVEYWMALLEQHIDIYKIFRITFEDMRKFITVRFLAYPNLFFACLR